MKPTLCKVPECPHFSRAVSGLCYAHRQKSPPESIRDIINLPESARGAWSKHKRLAQTTMLPVGCNGMGAESRIAPQTAEHASAAETAAFTEAPERVRVCWDCKLPVDASESSICRGCIAKRAVERDASRVQMGAILVPQFAQPRVKALDSTTWPAWVESVAVPVGVAGMLILGAALWALYS